METQALAQRLADYVVLAVAPEVPLIAADYWQLSAGSYRQVHAFVEARSGCDDILVDRGFLTRNTRRFDDPAHHAHLPYRRIISLGRPQPGRP